MTIKIGDYIPDGTLIEFMDNPNIQCTIGPNVLNVFDLAKNKKIALFAVFGAFTPICSEKHLLGYLKKIGDFQKKGIEEIWCVSVNDAFVMRAWGRTYNVQNQIRLFADGSALWTKSVGLQLDLTDVGMGLRSHRYSALLENRKILQLNVDLPGKFKVSDADTLLSQI